MQTPHQRVSVQDLRNTRVAEEIARGRRERSDSGDRVYAKLGAPLAPKGYRVAIVWRVDHEAQRAATPYNNRYRRVFEELIALGIAARPVVYADNIAGELRVDLLTLMVSSSGSIRSTKAGRDKRSTRRCATLRHEALGSARTRRHPQDGGQGGLASDETSRLGHGHSSVPVRRGFPCCVPENIVVE